MLCVSTDYAHPTVDMERTAHWQWDRPHRRVEHLSTHSAPHGLSVVLVAACGDGGLKQPAVDDMRHQQARSVAEPGVWIEVAQQHDGHVLLELDLMLRHAGQVEAVE